MSAFTPAVDIRRAEDRFATDFSWLDSRHSFSFGHHHDPGNVHHGALLVNNDDTVRAGTVRAGTGFDTHLHRDMEIVTWVLQGSLVHQDSINTSGIIYPGPGSTDECRRRHSPLGKERFVDGVGRPTRVVDPLHPDVGAARHRRHHPLL
jgi:hypothetical protein